MSASIRSSSIVPPQRNLIISGWIFAFLMPIVGFILGIILTAKGRHGHGIAQIIVSILVGLVFLGAALDSAGQAVSESLDTYSACVDKAHTLVDIDNCSSD